MRPAGSPLPTVNRPMSGPRLQVSHRTASLPVPDVSFHVKHLGPWEYQLEGIAEDTEETLECAKVGKLNGQLSPPTNPRVLRYEEALNSRRFHVKQACALAAEAQRPGHALPTGYTRRPPSTAGIMYQTARAQNARLRHRRDRNQPQSHTTE